MPTYGRARHHFRRTTDAVGRNRYKLPFALAHARYGRGRTKKARAFCKHLDRTVPACLLQPGTRRLHIPTSCWIGFCHFPQVLLVLFIPLSTHHRTTRACSRSAFLLLPFLVSYLHPPAAPTYHDLLPAFTYSMAPLLCRVPILHKTSSIYNIYSLPYMRPFREHFPNHPMKPSKAAPHMGQPT